MFFDCLGFRDSYLQYWFLFMIDFKNTWIWSSVLNLFAWDSKQPKRFFVFNLFVDSQIPEGHTLGESSDFSKESEAGYLQRSQEIQRSLGRGHWEKEFFMTDLSVGLMWFGLIWLIWFDLIWFDLIWFDWLINWLTDWWIDWLIDWLIDSLIDWLIDWLTAWLIDWLTDWRIDWLIEWLNDWMID